MHSFRKSSLISEACQIEHTQHKKWNWPAFCYIQGKTIARGAFQQTCEAPLSVDCGSERPSRDSQLEIFPITHSLESDNSDRLSFLTFIPWRSPASRQINSENICFVPPYASWIVYFFVSVYVEHRCDNFSKCDRWSILEVITLLAWACEVPWYSQRCLDTSVLFLVLL